MIKAMIVSVVVCWSLFVVNGQIGKEERKYLPATQILNQFEEPAFVWAALNWKPEPIMLSFRMGFPQTTKTDYRKMVVMRDVLTQSTHPP